MFTRILDALTRRLDVSEGEPGHFHAGPRGPYPCHDPSCTRSRSGPASVDLVNQRLTKSTLVPS